MCSEKPSLLLLSATLGEAIPIIEAMTDVQEENHTGKSWFSGSLEKQPCRLVVTGIAPVNTAHALTCELETDLPRLVLQFGIAGAYIPAKLSIGSVACATEEIYGDVGVLTPEGWKPAEEIGFPLIPGDPPRFNHFPLDAALVSRAAEVCDARAGIFVTLSQCTGLQSVGDTLFHRFGAICESMEGAAAAHVCALYGVPFLELRGISNLVEDRDRSRWRIPEALAAVQQAVRQVISHIDEVLDGG